MEKTHFSEKEEKDEKYFRESEEFESESELEFLEETIGECFKEKNGNKYYKSVQINSVIYTCN